VVVIMRHGVYCGSTHNVAVDSSFPCRAGKRDSANRNASLCAQASWRPLDRARRAVSGCGRTTGRVAARPCLLGSEIPRPRPRGAARGEAHRATPPTNASATRRGAEPSSHAAQKRGALDSEGARRVASRALLSPAWHAPMRAAYPGTRRVSRDAKTYDLLLLN
jgi:hypothetical protein